MQKEKLQCISHAVSKFWASSCPKKLTFEITFFDFAQPTLQSNQKEKSEDEDRDGGQTREGRIDFSREVLL